MENTPLSPLNTGNGVPPATPATTTPTPIIPKPAYTPNPQMKKYLIAGVAAVAILAIIYLAYDGFMRILSMDSNGAGGATDTTTTSTIDLTNKLTAPSDTSATTPDTSDKTQLNNVVNELKDQYKSDTSTPPSLTLTPAPASDTSTGGIKR